MCISCSDSELKVRLINFNIYPNTILSSSLHMYIFMHLCSAPSAPGQRRRRSQHDHDLQSHQGEALQVEVNTRGHGDFGLCAPRDGGDLRFAECDGIFLLFICFICLQASDERGLGRVGLE